MSLRRLAMGVSTVLGLARKGFFIPYRYADRLPKPGGRATYGAVEDLMHAQIGGLQDVLLRIDAYAVALRAIGGAPPPAPRWDQDWFPGLDAAAAYALLRDHRPARIVEVGSGHSTRFLARAAADGGFPCQITAIDPAPRAMLSGLTGVKVARATLQEAGLSHFESLGAGDVLFVDSSHVLMPGSDVDLVLNHVLPRISHGALIHVHDIFLPDDYPKDWAWRGYNEQLAVVSLLLSEAYELIFASHYVATRLSDALTRSVVSQLPSALGARASSLWMRKR